MGPGNRPLDMEWLEDFVTLAKMGNFSRAAEARMIAQPAFSRHIRSLEEWAGVDLVDRSAHPVELTAAGQRFLPLLEEVLASLEAARIKARAARDRDTASLSFAVTHVLSLHFFPQWMSGYEEHIRLGCIQTMSDSYMACENMMMQRRVQFALCYGHPKVVSRLDEGKFPVVRLDTELLIPVCAPGEKGLPLHPLDGTTPMPVLAYNETSILGRIINTQLKNSRDPVFGQQIAAGEYTTFTAHSALLIKTMTLTGKGMAWLPQRLIFDELQSGSLVECGSGQWHIPLEIRLYRQPGEMSAAAESLWKLSLANQGDAPHTDDSAG